jgi:hypothetical protein
MKKKQLDEFQKEIRSLMENIEQLKILNSYPGVIPQEWIDEQEKLIKIKKRLPKLLKIMSNITVL